MIIKKSNIEIIQISECKTDLMFIVSLIILKPQLIFQSFGVKKYLTKNEKKIEKTKSREFSANAGISAIFH